MKYLLNSSSFFSNEVLLSLFIGSLVGFVGGFQGIAGGFYIITLLMYTQLAKTQRQAAGTTLLAIVFPLSIGALREYYNSGDVNVKQGLLIAFSYMVFATIGAKYNNGIDERYVMLSLAFLLLLTSGYIFTTRVYI